jgi:co-chaperonin GroES (HSP10)
MSLDLSRALDLSKIAESAKKEAELELEVGDKEKATVLPEPSGYHILCAIPDMEEKYESGIIKADSTRHAEEVLSTVFFVVKMGPDCYQDKTRFPNGPWCKVGDFILARPNTGTRLKIHGREFRIINDDSVEGTVLDPRGISRV